MNNRRLEYNPLFESITDSARRYETISENTVDKMKYAVEYARRIIETCYSQYVYFVNSVPDAAVKTKLLTELDTFLKGQITQQNLDVKTFFDSMISKMEDLVKQISGNQSIRNLENFDKLQSIYDKIEQGKDELKNVTMEEYTKQYAAEYTSDDVKLAVKNFVTFSSQALTQVLDSTVKK
jgi:hypothetical protein